MSILNALSVFAGGAAQGYRAREETNRQIAEVKRKALLEEREQQIREAAQRTQESLAKQQILESQANVTKTGVETQGEKNKQTREAKSVTGDLGLGDLRHRLGISDLNYGDITSPGMSGILERMLTEQGNTAELNARINNPYIIGSHKPYLPPEEEALVDLAERKRQSLLSRIDPMQFTADPSKFSQFIEEVNKQTEAELPARLRKLLQANRDSIAADSSRAAASRKPKKMPSARGR